MEGQSLAAHAIAERQRLEQENREADERYAAAQAARAAAEASAAAAAAAGPQYAGGEEEYWEEWEEWEEGGYEEVAYNQGRKEGHEELRVEPAVLYQSLGATSEANIFFGGEWSRIFAAYGSRCEQYGGHWVGHTCHLGRHSSGGGSQSACEFVAGSGGSIVGGAVGSIAGPPGTFVGGLVGGWLGSKVCG